MKVVRAKKRVSISAGNVGELIWLKTLKLSLTKLPQPFSLVVKQVDSKGAR